MLQHGLVQGLELRELCLESCQAVVHLKFLTENCHAASFGAHHSLPTTDSPMCVQLLGLEAGTTASVHAFNGSAWTFCSLMLDQISQRDDVAQVVPTLDPRCIQLVLLPSANRLVALAHIWFPTGGTLILVLQAVLCDARDAENMLADKFHRLERKLETNWTKQLLEEIALPFDQAIWINRIQSSHDSAARTFNMTKANEYCLLQR